MRVGGWAGLGAAVGLGEVGGVVCAVNIVSRLDWIVSGSELCLWVFGGTYSAPGFGEVVHDCGVCEGVREL